MSRTELYFVDQAGDVWLHSEYQNSWRGAMLVWMAMARHYLGGEPGFNIGGLSKSLQPVWDLFKDTRLPVEMRIVLGSTFDKVMVRKENLPRLITAIRAFERITGDGGNLVLQIPAFEALYLEDDCTAVCWNQTSVCHSPWEIPDDSADDGVRSYNINRDKEHWFLFEELELQAQQV